MILHNFYLPKYRWNIQAFYDVQLKYTDVIIEEIRNIEGTKEEIDDIRQLLNSNQKNIGFTYSNPMQKESLIVIGPCTSSEEAMNTLVHEARHLQQHIQDFYKISDDSEEIYYMIGKIIQIMYKKFKLVLDSY